MKQFLFSVSLLVITLPTLANDLFIWATKVHNPNTSTSNENLNGLESSYSQGRFFNFDKDHYENLSVGDSFNVNLPQQTSKTAVITQARVIGGTKQLLAYIKHPQQKLPIVITLGPNQFFMRVVTPEHIYVAQGNNNTGSLINENQLLAQHNKQQDDVKLPPSKAKAPSDLANSATFKLPDSAKNLSSSNNNRDIAPIKILFVHGLSQSQIDDNYSGDINTRIQHIIGVTNQIYLDSNVDIEIAATSILSVDYPVENHSDVALDDITYAQHSAFTNIEDIRYQQGADMVVLLRMFVDGDDSCGLAWANSSISSSINFMYSHTSIDCGDYVNAHELGHNMGLAHSQAQGDTGYTFPFARGYRIEDAVNGFSTVMAYSLANAPKIYKFSNPDILCTELACGIDRADTNNGADASYALNQIRFQVADLFEDQTNDTLITNAANNITDNNLRQCVEQTSNSQNIKYVGQLKELYCNRANVNNLEGISSFTSLTRLDINGNNITNLNNLSELDKLSILSVNDNPINDFSGLANLTSITELSLANTGLNDLSVIANLTALKFLWVPDNNISNLTTLSNLTNLSYLYAIRNNIEDITPLAQLKQLETLHLTSNQVSQVSPIRQLTALATLYIDSNNVSSLNSLSGHVSLTNISSNFNAISSLENVGEFPKLSSLSLTGNQLTNVPSLDMPALTKLELSQNSITHIATIKSLTKLQELNLYDNPISELSVENLPASLSSLNIGNTQISSLAFVEQLPNIGELNIQNTTIDDVSSLNRLLRLMSLNLADTNISDVSSLFNLHNFWSDLDFAGAENVYCWQLDHIERYFVFESISRPISCNASQDSFDFDQDGITNRLELTNGTNPVFSSSLPGELSFQLAQLSLHEESGNASLKIVRTGGELGEINVDIFTENGTGTVNNDFEAINEQLTFGNAEHVKQITLTLVQDDDADYGKQFTIRLANPLGTTLGTFSSMTITLTDDDSGVFAWQTSKVQVAEDTTNFVVNIERTGTASSQAQIGVSAINGTATLGSDFQFDAQTITFNSGETLKQVNVSLLNDEIAEPSENFYLELNNAVNAKIDDQNKLVNIEVSDDDISAVGTISFEQSALTINESAGTVTVNVRRENGDFGEVAVNYEFINGTATNGNDYSASNGTISFANGEIEKSITFNVTEDTSVESSENFTIKLSSSNPALLGTNTELVITISDNDTSVTPPNNASSGGGGGSFAWLLVLLLLIPCFKVTLKQA
ncbi:Calx-beta domain-containing protein [Thalassotalea marina]|uniref:Calx-beta domain-containing protein n=1 Tax=Thalassotalea marina TaxID=1673741 RepID=A0A919EKJ4_9GAMM|nr:Calx-beta domain-containing protein [Thalassotalea marina]GHF92302.1 hypothetical protein GCM10017161_20510 [Thalassotalea marina]